MKLVALFSLVIFADGCSGHRAVSDQGASHRRAVSETDARSIAERVGREANYDLGLYRIVTIEYEQEGSFANTWRVFFEHVDPAPPGGHFTVHVDATSGEAQIRHGE